MFLSLLFLESGLKTTDYMTSFDWLSNKRELPGESILGTVEVVVHTEREEEYETMLWFFFGKKHICGSWGIGAPPFFQEMFSIWMDIRYGTIKTAPARGAVFCRDAAVFSLACRES